MQIFSTVYIVIATVCAVVGSLHLLIYVRRTDLKVHLIFSIMALSSAVSTVFDLWMFTSRTIPDFAYWLKMTNNIQVVLWISFVWFVKVYTGNPRRWLPYSVTGIYLLALVINIISPYGILYLGINRLEPVAMFWGEQIQEAVGPAHPLRLIADLAWILMLVYAGKSTLQLGRKGDKRRAWFFGTSVFACIGVGYLSGTLVDLNIQPAPSLYNISFLALILLMSSSLANEVVKSSLLLEKTLAQEKRWQALIENIKMAVISLAPSGTVNYANPYFYELTGFDQEDILGKPISTIIPTDEKKEHRSLLLKALRNGALAPLSYRSLITSNGRTRKVRWADVVLNDGDEVRGILSIGEDVTDILEAQAALSAGAEKMDAVLSSLNTGLALMDRNLNVIWANEMIRKTLPFGDPVGLKCYSFAENRETPCEDCGALKVLEDGQIHESTRFNANAAKWYKIVSLPVKDEKGNLTGVLESTTDITEQIQKEQAIQDIRNRTRILADNTYGWEFWLNPSGTFEWVSLSSERITGYKPDDFVKDRSLYSRLIHPEDRQKYDKHREQVNSTTQSHEIEFRIVHRNGEVRWINHVSLKVYDNKGEYLGIRGSNRDITDKKIAEADRDKALKELEQLKNTLEEENLYLKKEISDDPGFSEIIGNSNAVHYVKARIRQVSETDATVLVQGETGVGKELVAQAVYNCSNRVGKPYIKVNCAALAPNLIESEIFGHVAGAYTNADSARKGRFELADKGTLLLDEIGELPLDLQAKLLRVLQEGQFEKVGGTDTISVDVRVIATTNRDLQLEMNQGTFRPDLYYRLQVYPITVPPLRKRMEDIEDLAIHFLHEINAQVGKNVEQIPRSVLKRLNAYDYPGNVRELRNLLYNAVISARDGILRLPDSFMNTNSNGISRSVPGQETVITEDVPNPNPLDEVQRNHIQKILAQTNGRIEGPNGAAAFLEMKPSTLRYRMKKLGIKRS